MTDPSNDSGTAGVGTNDKFAELKFDATTDVLAAYLHMNQVVHFGIERPLVCSEVNWPVFSEVSGRIRVDNIPVISLGLKSGIYDHAQLRGQVGSMSMIGLVSYRDLPKIFADVHYAYAGLASICRDLQQFVTESDAFEVSPEFEEGLQRIIRIARSASDLDFSKEENLLYYNIRMKMAHEQAIYSLKFDELISKHRSESKAFREKLTTEFHTAFSQRESRMREVIQDSIVRESNRVSHELAKLTKDIGAKFDAIESAPQPGISEVQAYEIARKVSGDTVRAHLNPRPLEVGKPKGAGKANNPFLNSSYSTKGDSFSSYHSGPRHMNDVFGVPSFGDGSRHSAPSGLSAGEISYVKEHEKHPNKAKKFQVPAQKPVTNGYRNSPYAAVDPDPRAQQQPTSMLLGDTGARKTNYLTLDQKNDAPRPAFLRTKRIIDRNGD